MDRRTAVIWAGSVLVTACGGGGGGFSAADTAGVAPAPSPAPAPPPTPAPAPAPAPTPAPALPPPGPQPVLSSNIACWGDSMTTPFAPNLQLLYPNRTVFNGGIPGEKSTQIAARQLADNSMTSWITVLWYGMNNQADPNTIKADLATSIAHLTPGNTRFVVLGVVNEAKPSEIKGGMVYDLIVRLNNELSQLYPQNYIDMRAWLVSHYDPNNAQDVLDFQNDVPPSSLRYDEIHLRNEGSILVAERVKQFIDGKGW
jgi:hypothetical protein